MTSSLFAELSKHYPAGFASATEYRGGAPGENGSGARKKPRLHRTLDSQHDSLSRHLSPFKFVGFDSVLKIEFQSFGERSFDKMSQQNLARRKLLQVNVKGRSEIVKAAVMTETIMRGNRTIPQEEESEIEESLL